MHSSPTLQVTPPSRHADAWSARLRTARPLPVDELGLEAGDQVLAVVAHPDDEVLAMGGLLASLAERDVAVQVVSLTCGEAAVDHVGVHPDDLGRRRVTELHDAASRLRVQAHGMQWPDSRLAEFDAETTDFVEDAARRYDARRLLTLWRDDPHPDHQAASRVTRAAGARRGTPVTELLLWTVHWTDPSEVTERVRPVRLGEAARRRRAHAMAAYTSQTTPLADYLEPVLPDTVVSWPHECVVA